MPADSVQVDVPAGRATFQLQDFHLKDYTDIANALLGGGPNPQPSTVSFRVEWTAFGSAHVFDNAAQQFRGTFRDATAQMDWTARSVDYDFVSSPLATSTSAAAELGLERNGSFY